jgi:DNA-binding MarR family transcriptional regulator
VRGRYDSFVKKDAEPSGWARGRGSTAFLLAQVGGQAAARYAERLGSLGLTPAQSGMLRVLGNSAGISQKALAETLSILPSRLVVLVDELEERGLIERRDRTDDRRVYELYLSEKGRQALEAVGRVARAHDEAFLQPLDEEERGQLRVLLGRLADTEGLTPGVHPGYRRLTASEAEGSAKAKRAVTRRGAASRPRAR